MGKKMTKKQKDTWRNILIGMGAAILVFNYLVPLPNVREWLPQLGSGARR